MTVVKFPDRRSLSVKRYGGCTRCGAMTGSVIAGGIHYCVCDLHRQKWVLAVLNPEDYGPTSLALEYKIDGYRLVEPVWPKPKEDTA